jgi:hypothetical protein
MASRYYCLKTSLNGYQYELEKPHAPGILRRNGGIL